MRLAIRRLLRRPRETAAIVLSLALGAGFVGAVSAVLHAALLTPLPFAEPARIVRLWDGSDAIGGRHLSSPDIDALRGSDRIFRAVAAYEPVTERITVAGSDVSRPIAGARVGVGLFRVLGVSAARGRTFSAEDHRLSPVLPIVVSERLVRRGVVAGRTGEIVLLNGQRHTLVGVMPADFWFPTRRTDFWVPIVIVPAALRGGSQLESKPAVARLADGITTAAAAAGGSAVLGRESPRRVLSVEPFHADLTESLRIPLQILSVGACLLLILVVLNTGWLFVARTRRRERELEIMSALGAGPARAVTGYLTDAIVAGALATPAAEALAWILLRLVRAYDSGVVSVVTDPVVGGQVMLITMASAVVSGAIAAAPGAWLVARIVSRRRPPAVVRRSVCPRYQALMMAQGALVFALALQAVFLVLLLRGLFEANIGFGNTDLVVARVEPRASGTAGATVEAVGGVLRYLERAGFRAAAANDVPLTGGDDLTSVRPADETPEHQVMSRLRGVSASYSSVCGLVTVAGRPLASDDRGSGRVMVSDVFAKQVLAGRQPLGARIVFGGAPWEVIGVYRSVRHSGFDEPPVPEMMMLHDDGGRLSAGTADLIQQQVCFLVRSEGKPARTAERLRAAIASQWPGARVADVWDFEDLLRLSAGGRPLATLGAAVFAGLALYLLASGFYGMVSHTLVLRKREIGVRLALGASPARIFSESARPAVLVGMVSVGAGLIAAAGVFAVVSTVIYAPAGAPQPSVAGVFLVAVMALTCAIGAAFVGPAINAARVDPIITLRAE